MSNMIDYLCIYVYLSINNVQDLCLTVMNDVYMSKHHFTLNCQHIIYILYVT